MNHRLINYLVGVYLFFYYVLWAESTDHIWLISALILGVIVSGVALLFNWFSTDGAFAALIHGIVALGVGHWFGAGLLLIFVGGSYGIAALLSSDEAHSLTERRTGRQVWSNGFWFTLGIIIWSITEDPIWLIASAGAITAALADTSATLTGTGLTSGRVVSILNFKKVTPGVDGGVSFTGTLTAIAASLVAATLAAILYPVFEFQIILIVWIAGFSGCIVDSYLGAVFQYQNRAIKLPWITDHPFYFSNNKVNAVATGWGFVVSWLLYHVI